MKLKNRRTSILTNFLAQTKSIFIGMIHFFKNLNLSDFVFVVNTHRKYVLFTKLDAKEIPIKVSGDKTTFSDSGHEYTVSGKWGKFIRVTIIKELPTPENWKWKSLGQVKQPI